MPVGLHFPFILHSYIGPGMVSPTTAQSPTTLHDELVFVLRRFHVAVRGERTDELTALLLDFQTASDLHGDVLAVRIVNQVFERDNNCLLYTSRCV